MMSMFSMNELRKRLRRKKFHTADLLRGSNLEIGEHTYGKPEIFQYGEKSRLCIGRYCSISTDVRIFLGGNHRVDWVTTYPFPVIRESWPEASCIPGHPSSKGDVVIGNDVWIGLGATILSGVTIGDGAVIGAQSVVTRDVPPYRIAAGNPITIVGQRFDDETIRRLLEIRWWNWPEDKIVKYIDILCSNRVDVLLEQFK